MKKNRPARVLVIDDDEIARELLGSELEQAGFEVLSLPSPIGASRVIQAHDVNAVVLDVVMPAMSGDRLAALLRNNPRFANLALVLVSSQGAVELHKLAATVGADAVVSKKDIRKVLADSVLNALRARAQSPSTALPARAPESGSGKVP
jgi:CheY-like chemotaxis protein